ncbi:MAG: response regulator [Thermodesulfobacteriota bacterium]|nr:response regulator [Thermodesulfobacteriota bacterium]
MEQDQKRILVIEDDQEVRNMLKDYLVYLGYKIVTAGDGLQGLKEIKGRDYDLVITDITMPYVSGIGIISVLKQNHPNIPVIAITGYGYHVEELAYEKKADRILSKPFEIQELKEAIENLLI